MNTKQIIEQQVTNNSVVLYMKGTPQFPQCGFSSRVVQLLKTVGQEKFLAINVLEDDAIRQGIKEYSEWPTIPQLYVNGEFIGGCDIINEMSEAGELKDLFSKKL